MAKTKSLLLALLAGLTACGPLFGSPTPIPTPPARLDGTMATDPSSHAVVLFSGVEVGSHSQKHDMWAWDGSKWNQLAAQSPDLLGAASVGSPVNGGILAYTPGTVSLFDPTGFFFTDSPHTYLFKHNGWSELHPSVSPHLGNGPMSMAYDRINDRALLYGSTGGGAAELWAWNGVVWSRLWAADPSAATNAYPAYIAAVGDGRIIGIGTSTFVWGANQWQPLATVSPPAVIDNLAVDDLGSIVVYGRSTADSNLSTFVFDGSQWKTVSSAPKPAGRLFGTMGYDGSHKQLLFFGGRTGDSTSSGLTDTWVWDGKTWGQVG